MRQHHLVSGAVIAILIGILFYPVGVSAQEPAQEKPTTQKSAAKPAIYDTTADAKVQIAIALAKAKRENQRVLLQFGGNWCGWCHKLHDVFKNNKTIARILLYEYRLVLVDIGRFNKHMDVAAEYGADLRKHGVPFLTVLDADGKALANQETGSLEVGRHHDPEKVAAFLNKWKAEPLDAEKVLSAALAKAAADQKSVFLHLGAPWCPWCHRLDDFLARKEIAAVLQQDLIDLKIDVDRMTHGKEVAMRIRRTDKGGIPWFAVLDAQGKVLATSDGSKGNVGFPVRPPEIEHFLGVLKKTTKRMSAEQIVAIQKALEDSAAEIKRRMQRRDE